MIEKASVAAAIAFHGRWLLTGLTMLAGCTIPHSPIQSSTASSSATAAIHVTCLQIISKINNSSGPDPGPAWDKEFRDWVSSHGHYPPAALNAGEEGCPSVRFTVLRDGTIQSVVLRRHSGSELLDAGLLSLFQSHTVPPFPPSSKKQSDTFTFTINYFIK